MSEYYSLLDRQVQPREFDDSSSIDIYSPVFNPNHNLQFLRHNDPSLDTTKYTNRAPLIKQITFTDIIPYIKKLNKIYPRCNFWDIPDLDKSFDIERIICNLDNNWADEQKKANPKFSRALYRTFIGEILQSFIFTFIDCTARIFHAMYMGKIIRAITFQNSGEGLISEELITFAVLLSLFIIISLFAKNWGFYLSIAGVTKARLAIVGLIYKKLNSISTSSLHEMNVGKVANLIGNELSDLPNLALVPNLIFNPYLVLLGTYLMWTYFELSCLIGLSSLILIFALQICFSNMTNKPRKESRVIADERIKYTHEMIDSIRLIKIYTWEELFQKRILDLREKEQKSLVKITYIDAIGRSLSNIAPYFAILLICTCNTIFEQTLSSEKIYASIIILTYLGSSLKQAYLGSMGYSNLKTVLKRVEEVMEIKDVANLEEISPGIFISFAGIKPTIFTNFTAFWSKNSQTPCLSNINITFRPGVLYTVIEKIGSGKTSLLLSFLKEMQDPVIFVGTIRNNVLFGNEYDEDLYHKVLEACNLFEDLEAFPGSDLTHIREKGATISGGQRARLSLARALYSQSDIYLLDDPFSALDGKVALKMFNKALKGDLLKDKIIILTTHNLHFARKSDHIIVMEEGRIEAQGKFEDIENLQLSFLSAVPPDRERVEAKKIEVDTNKQSNTLCLERTIFTAKEGFEAEDEDSTEVTLNTYKKYFKINGTIGLFILFFLLFLIPEIFSILFMLLIGNWASREEMVNYEHKGFLKNQFDNNVYIMVTSGLLVLISITNYIKIVKFNSYLIKTNTEMHKKMLAALFRARLLFYDVNPTGKILDRFSGDLGSLDVNNQKNLFDFFEGIVSHLCLLITVCFINPIVFIPGLVAILVLYQIVQFFTKPMISSARLNILSRNPLVTLAMETLQGLIIIRVYKQGEKFIREFMELLYLNLKAFVFYNKVTRLLSLLLDVPIQVLTISGIWAFLIIIFYYNLQTVLIGLCFTYLLKIADQSSYIVRQALYMNNNMQGAQRILDYSQIESEKPYHIPEIDDSIKATASTWPQRGEIVFNNVYLGYREDYDLVLKGISFTISPGEKVAIVGRTGSGKSSIVQALFRMVEIESGPNYPDSFIKIDGVDTKTIGLHLLRSGLSIIPQKPPSLKSTIRENIDPFEKHTDEEIWGILEEVGLKKHLHCLENKLQTDMTISQNVLSSGQKQLLCLARAMIDHHKVIVLDEATANIDYETDKLIQTQVKEKLKDCNYYCTSS